MQNTGNEDCQDTEIGTEIVWDRWSCTYRAVPTKIMDKKKGFFYEKESSKICVGKYRTVFGWQVISTVSDVNNKWYIWQVFVAGFFFNYFFVASLWQGNFKEISISDKNVISKHWVKLNKQKWVCHCKVTNEYYMCGSSSCQLCVDSCRFTIMGIFFYGIFCNCAIFSGVVASKELYDWICSAFSAFNERVKTWSALLCN